MYLGIDCGTQSTKVVILNPNSGSIIAQGSAPHELISNAQGAREQHPQWWVNATVAAIKQALAQAEIASQSIDAIGVSAQQHGLVALDHKGQVLCPAKLWCDTQTSDQNQQLLNALGGEQACLTQLGLVIAPGFTVSKLLWLKQQQPHIFQKIRHIMLPHDYLNYWLTGNIVSEFGDASGTGYFDIRQRRWNHQIIELIDDSRDLIKALPELISAEQSVGKVRPNIARKLGLRNDVIVASGGGDNMMGAIGTANTHRGEVTMSLGTSGTVYSHTPAPSCQLQPQVANFCSSSNGWLPLICTMNATNVTNIIQQLFELDVSQFNRQLATTPAGADGLLFLPFINGERTPALPNASASLLGINPYNLSSAHLARAAVEGTSLSLRYGLARLKESGIECRTIKLIGGGAKSRQWREVIANMMDTPVVCPQTNQAAALGAAIQAAWCHQLNNQPVVDKQLLLNKLCSEFVSLDQESSTEPEAQNVAIYDQLYARYQQAMTTLYY